MEVDKEIVVLVADDSIGIRMIAKKIFKKLGYTNVVVVDDGSTAMDYLNENSVDLVVADWNMPELSGIDLAKKMRLDDSLKNIPFLLVTAEEDQDAIMEALRAGVNNYMTKPYDAKVLQEKIEKMFSFKERKSSRRPSQ
ncbi:MAG: response regulator [Proteobacteria bacterium]|nr:response regulator [Pseudomonadota bacterium]